MATTKKPTKLKITRKDDKYIFSWSRGESYGDGQQLQWSYEASKTHKSKVIKLSGSKQEYTVTSPSKLSLISFKVRGNHDQKKKDPGWSDWAKRSFKVKVPHQPTITTTWEEDTPNKTVFTYETKDDDHYPFDHVEYRTMWVKDYNGEPSSYNWKGEGDPTTSTSKTGTIFDTPEAIVPNESWTRIVQIRAVGPGGVPKEWIYASHTYAQPNAPVITKAEGKEIPSKNMTTLDLEWNTSEDSAHPIDETIIQYKMATPGAGMSFPATENPTDADTPVNIGENAWAEEVQGLLSDDQCLFARVKVVHDTRDNVSEYSVALKGNLAEPQNVTTNPVPSTHVITVNATNASAVPDSYLAVIYKKGATESIMGIIPHGQTSVNMVVPEWDDSAGGVGVYAVVGSYTAQPADEEGVVIYTIQSPQMTSDVVWKGIIGAPVIDVVQADVEETATVTWSWTDPSATGAEVSWSAHEDAWESTEEPDTYIVDASRASRLNVSGLEPGIMWYFRVRLITESDDTTYGLYSKTFALNLSSAPAIPSLEMSSQVIDPSGEAIASWVFVSGDNTPQAHATLALYSEGVYKEILQVGAEQTAVIRPSALKLEIGSYQLAVKVESESGRWSEYSAPIPFNVAAPLVCSITTESLVSRTQTIDEEEYTFPYCLTELPMTITVTGAGETGQTTLKLKRKEDITIARPDDTELVGYPNEVVYQSVYRGEAQQTITTGDIASGKLNDGATYYFEATVTDNLGRTSEPVRYPNDDPDDYFTVIWDEQAIMPEATAEIIEDDYAKLTITKPQDWHEGDTVDIYRMTADRPQLIAEDIEMDDTPVEYVDPYPTLGKGGYRFVYKTVNGDDTLDSASNFAWLDVPVTCESQEAIIDFNGERLPLSLNLKVSHKWSKDFQETKYLGGHITGDWIKGTSRTGSISAVTVPVRDPAAFEAIRRLAVYEDVCHVRTIDGSVITCNIDVDEDFGYDTAGQIQNVSLSFTRIDPVDFDGIPLADWLVTP